MSRKYSQQQAPLLMDTIADTARRAVVPLAYGAGSRATAAAKLNPTTTVVGDRRLSSVRRRQQSVSSIRNSWRLKYKDFLPVDGSETLAAAAISTEPFQ